MHMHIRMKGGNFKCAPCFPQIKDIVLKSLTSRVAVPTKMGITGSSEDGAYPRRGLKKQQILRLLLWTPLLPPPMILPPTKGHPFPQTRHIATARYQAWRLAQKRRRCLVRRWHLPHALQARISRPGEQTGPLLPSSRLYCHHSLALLGQRFPELAMLRRQNPVPAAVAAALQLRPPPLCGMLGRNERRGGSNAVSRPFQPRSLGQNCLLHRNPVQLRTPGCTGQALRDRLLYPLGTPAGRRSPRHVTRGRAGAEEAGNPRLHNLACHHGTKGARSGRRSNQSIRRAHKPEEARLRAVASPGCLTAASLTRLAEASRNRVNHLKRLLKKHHYLSRP
mmetsp:Transcript_48090/g.95329  ORF Transcript_48090/g.95329 Transcript_48090/m.95329 type:complete len:336 (+) Transcript_48090:31-1038(+)